MAAAEASLIIPPRIGRDDFEIAIICVLPVERDAVEALMTEKYTELGRVENDENFYVAGVFGGKRVILAAPKGMGNLNAAETVLDMRHSFNKIRLALLTGVAGGAPRTPDGHEILLGDVLISERVIKPDFGKRYAGTFDISDGLGRPTRELQKFVGHISRTAGARSLAHRVNKDITSEGFHEWIRGFEYPGHGNDRLFPSRYPHRHRGAGLMCDCKGCITADDIVCHEARQSRCDALECELDRCVPRERIVRFDEPTSIEKGGSQARLLQSRSSNDSRGPPLPAKVHFGTVASADHVLKSSSHRDRLMSEHKVIGFEMEGAGCWDTFPTLVVKGVCDYADGHKDKRWQPYASATAACCAKAIVEDWQTAQPTTSDSTKQLGCFTPRASPVLREILKGLFTTNPVDDLDSVKKRIRNGLGAAPQTCEWIHEHDAFQEWHRRPTPQFLTLVGPPGIGKSTLSTVILSRWQAEAKPFKTGVAFFFCDAAVETRRTYLVVVKSILRQLLAQNPALLSIGLVTDFDDQGSALFSNVRALSRHLIDLLGNADLNETRILIDALDECEESSRGEVYGLFSDMCRPERAKTGASIRILLTHRPGGFHNFARLVPQHAQSIRLDQEWHVSDDVYQFINSEVDELSTTVNWDEETTTKVRELLYDKCGGTFLWVAVAFRSIRHARSDNVIEILEELPADLDDMFIKILRQIPQRDRSKAALALHCVVADVQYLTQMAFGALLACSEIKGPNNALPTAAHIRRLQTSWKSCEILLRVDGSSGVLQTIHQSINDFFKERALPEDLVLFRFDPAHTCDQITALCRAYLSCSDFLRLRSDMELVAVGKTCNFSAWNLFANREHFEMLRLAKHDMPTSESISRIRECNSSNSFFLGYSNLLALAERHAFWHGLQTSSQLPKHQRDLCDESNFFDFVLRSGMQLAHFATVRRHSGIANVLEAAKEGWWFNYFFELPDKDRGYLELWNKGKYTSSDSETLIHNIVDAIIAGSTDFAITLADRVSEYRKVDSDEGIMYALVVKELMIRGHEHAACALRFMDQTQGRIPSHGTYLHYLARANAAAILPHLDGEQRLYDLDDEGLSPVHTAASRGSFEFLRASLAVCPAAIRYRDSTYERTPLLHAAQNDCERSVRYLLQADGLSEDGEVILDYRGRSPLHAAVRHSVSSIKCLPSLIDAAPYLVHLRDDTGTSPLHLAAEAQNVPSIRLLLAAGADPLIEDNFGSTAIHRALYLPPDDSLANDEEAVSILWDYITPKMVQSDRASPTLLMSTAQYGLMNYVKECLKMGADVSRLDDEGRSALHYAAEYSCVEVIEALLQADIPPHIFCKKARSFEYDMQDLSTPLQYAVCLADFEMARLLIAADTAGESLWVEDKNGRLPVDVAGEASTFEQCDRDALCSILRVRPSMWSRLLERHHGKWSNVKIAFQKIEKMLQAAMIAHEEPRAREIQEQEYFSDEDWHSADEGNPEEE